MFVKDLKDDMSVGLLSYLRKIIIMLLLLSYEYAKPTCNIFSSIKCEILRRMNRNFP